MNPAVPTGAAPPRQSRQARQPCQRSQRWLASAVVIAAATLCTPGRAADRLLAVCADPSNLPYSDERQQGFENQIAKLIADDMQATLKYTWQMQRRSFLRRTLNAGTCDVVVGLPAGLQGVLQTKPYYTSSYVFVTRKSRGLTLIGMDDPQLRDLKIGLQAVGAEGANTPPAMALARRGIVDKITGYAMWGEEADESPQRHIIDAVAKGDVDVAIVWGPLAGYFSQQQSAALQITPISGDPQQPEALFQYAMAVSVRKADSTLRDELQLTLDRRRADIHAILRNFGVPLVANAVRLNAPPTATSNHTLGLTARTSGD
jgi:mxaJ protein